MQIDTEILEETLESLDLIKVDTHEVKNLIEQWLSHSSCFVDNETEKRIMNDFVHDREEWEEGVNLVDIIDLLATKYKERVH